MSNPYEPPPPPPGGPQQPPPAFPPYAAPGAPGGPVGPGGPGGPGGPWGPGPAPFSYPTAPQTDAVSITGFVLSLTFCLSFVGVILGLVKNPKTPPGISMQLLHRLNEKEIKMIAVDRNVTEALRLVARKLMVKALR